MLPDNVPFLIGETAFHHQGNLSFLEELINGGIEAGVDVLKFHLLFDIDDYFVKDHVGYSAIKELMIPQSGWERIHELLEKKNISPIYLCNDTASLRWVKTLPEKSVLAVEIHATGINDPFLLQEALDFKATVILGAGGATIDDLHFAIDFLRSNGKNDILLMHGFQNYPTDYNDIVFSKMRFLKDVFNLPVGYADHTDPNDDLNAVISCIPMAQGFNILEKHFTHVPGEKRIDSQAAVSLGKITEIKKMMAALYATYGKDPLRMSEPEKKYGDTGPMRKAIVARHHLPKDHIIEIKDVAFKRTNSSVPVKQRDLHLIIGGKTKKEILPDTPLTFDIIEYGFRQGEFKQFFANKD